MQFSEVEFSTLYDLAGRFTGLLLGRGSNAIRRVVLRRSRGDDNPPLGIFAGQRGRDGGKSIGRPAPERIARTDVNDDKGGRRPDRRRPQPRLDIGRRRAVVGDVHRMTRSIGRWNAQRRQQIPLVPTEWRGGTSDRDQGMRVV